ncbi:hypothetical protein ACVBIO_20715 [Shewanella sp. 0m-8]
MSKNLESCYACNSAATSREHVPPKCLFPTELGKNLRKDLIRVPSCDQHNGKKSDDDEFLLASLAGIIGCNDIGILHKFTKVDRAIRRSGGRLLKKVLKTSEIKSHKLENGDVLEVAWGKPDLKRLHDCFELIGRGLYFHKLGERFKGKVICEVVYVPINDRGRAGYREFAVEQMQKEIANTDIQGENPEVFQWAIGPLDYSGACCGKIIFYGNLSVYLAFIPESFREEDYVNLYDIAKTASKPVYIQKDGKKYRIN